MLKIPVFSTTSLLIAISLLLSSCATIFNSDDTTLKVRTFPDATSFFLAGDNTEYISPVTLKLPRSDRDLHFTFQAPLAEKRIMLEHKYSLSYLLNFYPGCTFIWGYFVDRKSNRKFTYPRSLYVDMYDREMLYSKWPYERNKKGRLVFYFSMPEGNIFHFRMGNKPTNRAGFLGMIYGLEYYHEEKKSIYLRYGVLFDLFLPFIGAIDPPVNVDSYDTFWSTIASLQIFEDRIDNRHGYGAQITQFHYNKFIYQKNSEGYYSDLQEIQKYSTTTLGVALSYQRRLSRRVFLGINYLPSFVSISNSITFSYSHAIYLDFIFDYSLLMKKLLRKRV